ncbi:phage regulatory CII family protein [Ferirhizobium litorale]|uniref:Uncharacterized protein n=1 Tax=Ferirhizobium litorale TaxID=2927786 RepID=A0AAE3QIH7_9HYPH|nr:phage regulatory CII family protein [Fererhizobium litorale]MDI7924570.1 hypothetical protein [Fererhizobium litorale]
MRPIRNILEEEILRLIGATEASLKRGGGLSTFASLTRVTVATLSKYANPNADDEEDDDKPRRYVIPVDIAVEADRRAGGKPIIIGEAADLLGYELIPKSMARPKARKVTEGDALDLLAEVMDVVKAIRDAKTDGRIDAGERKAIEREIREAQRELDELLINLPEG